MGVMENKKKQTRKKIHQNALKLFEEKGFEKTTMRKIAEKSNIAVGTLYNYYNSKDSLIINLFEEKFGDISFKNHDIIERFKNNSDFNPLDVLFCWLDRYVNMFFILHKNTYKELFKIMFNNENFLKRGMKMDQVALEGLNRLLYFLDKKGFLKKHIEIEEVAFSIYSLFFGQTMGYLYYFENMDKNEFKRTLKKRVRMLFKGIEKREGEKI